MAKRPNEEKVSSYEVKRIPHPKTLDVTLAEERIEEIATMILEFKSKKDIVDFITVKYNVKPKTVNVLLMDAHRYIRDHRTTNFESIVERHIKTYCDIIRDNKTTDPRASMIAMGQLEKLLKLNSDAPIIQQNILNLNMDKIDNDQLIDYIKKIKEG